MMRAPHPFARFVQILGRGKTLTRSLTVEEAQEAMGMILSGEVLPEQLGAFLMLLRMKEESPEEIAGFVKASRAAMKRPDPCPRWTSTGPPTRENGGNFPGSFSLPFFWPRTAPEFFMHGMDGHTAGRVYTREVLAKFGILEAAGFGEAALQAQAPELCLYATGVNKPKTRGAIRPAVHLRPTLAGAYAVAHAKSTRRPGHAARDLPSRLHAHPSEGGASP